MVGHRRMPSDAVPLASPAGQLRSPAWMAVPDDDDEEATEVRQFSRGVSASAWWMAASLAILVLLLAFVSDGRDLGASSGLGRNLVGQFGSVLEGGGPIPPEK